MTHASCTGARSRDSQFNLTAKSTMKKNERLPSRGGRGGCHLWQSLQRVHRQEARNRGVVDLRPPRPVEWREEFRLVDHPLALQRLRSHLGRHSVRSLCTWSGVSCAASDVDTHRLHPDCSAFEATRVPPPGEWGHRAHHRVPTHFNTEAVQKPPLGSCRLTHDRMACRLARLGGDIGAFLARAYSVSRFSNTPNAA